MPLRGSGAARRPARGLLRRCHGGTVGRGRLPAGQAGQRDRVRDEHMYRVDGSGMRMTFRLQLGVAAVNRSGRVREQVLVSALGWNAHDGLSTEISQDRAGLYGIDRWCGAVPQSPAGRNTGENYSARPIVTSWSLPACCA